jgi:hypothetical protein
MIAEHFSDWRAMITTNREVASIWRRGQLALDSLDDEERVQFDNLVIQLFWAFGLIFLYREEHGIGDLPEEITMGNLPLLADSSGVEQWWKSSPHRAEYPAALVQLVDDFYAD